MAGRSENTRRSWFRYFQYEGRYSRDEARNVLWIVAGLIAIVTFQAGINLPGGVWQDDEKRAIYSDRIVERVLAILSMGVTYGSAIFTVTVGESMKYIGYILATAVAPFAIRGVPHIRGVLHMWNKMTENGNDHRGGYERL